MLRSVQSPWLSLFLASGPVDRPFFNFCPRRRFSFSLTPCTSLSVISTLQLYPPLFRSPASPLFCSRTVFPKLGLSLAHVFSHRFRRRSLNDCKPSWLVAFLPSSPKSSAPTGGLGELFYKANINFLWVNDLVPSFGYFKVAEFSLMACRIFKFLLKIPLPPTHYGPRASLIPHMSRPTPLKGVPPQPPLSVL